MQDLTKITTPFGLLDVETQEALRAHGGPYECWSLGDACKWTEMKWSFDWLDQHVYRVKPQPPEPREWWIVGGCEAWDTEESARESAAFLFSRASIVHVREVLE